jgi:hypothetical protein
MIVHTGLGLVEMTSFSVNHYVRTTKHMEGAKTVNHSEPADCAATEQQLIW